MRITYENLLKLLSSVSYLNPLRADFLPHLIDITEARVFRKNDIVMVEGEYEEFCCLILSGSVEVRVKNGDGRGEKKCDLKRGDFFGETAILGQTGRIASVKCNEKSLLLYMNKNALFSLMDHSSEFKKSVYDNYRARILDTDLRKNTLFAGLPDRFFREIIPVTHIGSYRKDETVLAYGEFSDDFFIILHGFARVLLPDKSLPESGHSGRDFNITGYLEPGDHFGDIPLLKKRERVSVIQAITRLDILRIKGEDFASVLGKFLRRRELLRQVVKNRKKQSFDFPADREFQKFLDWAISSHIVDSEAVLVIDLDKCVRCETCIDTCKLIHGDSRLRLNGYAYKNLLIPTSCRHCSDPECLKDCPTGAIYRNFSGEVIHKSNCIACNSCVKNCPWHNISLVRRRESKKRTLFELFNKKLMRKKSGKRGETVEILYSGKTRKNFSEPSGGNRRDTGMIAAKCDNCREYSKMGCVQNCPRGAARRIHPREYFRHLKKEYSKRGG